MHYWPKNWDNFRLGLDPTRAGGRYHAQLLGVGASLGPSLWSSKISSICRYDKPEPLFLFWADGSRVRHETEAQPHHQYRDFSRVIGGCCSAPREARSGGRGTGPSGYCGTYSVV